MCITLEPRKGELHPISRAVENALLLQYMILLCWQDAANVAIDKTRVPIYEEALQHFIVNTATLLKSLGQQVNRKQYWY